MKKIYYYLDLKQKAPLRLSSGDGEETDNDIRLDGIGLPYIPGTSLAGVLRSFMEKEDAKKIFGDIDIQKSITSKTNVTMPNRLIVSDGVLAPDTNQKDVTIISRDGVGLDDWGQAITGAKYDFQAVETEKVYHAVLEWTGNEKEEENEIKALIEPLLSQLAGEDIFFGARTTRGYGEMEMAVWKKEFTFPEELEEWLSYYPMERRFETESKGVQLKQGAYRNGSIDIEIDFCIKDSFNIRVNTARSERMEDGTIPDSVPLLNTKGQPVIPGTAWAGSFRHHMHRILRELGMTRENYEKEVQRIDYECFGISSEKKLAHKRSLIHFSETVIKGGMANTIIRNAVDRFTAAPKNTGLFTNQVWTGGTGKLRIRLDSKVKQSDAQLLLAAVYDMKMGLMTIGGEAGIGRGIAEIKRLIINKEDRTKILETGCLNIDEKKG